MDDLITWFEGGQFEEVDRSFAIWLTRLIRYRYKTRETPDMHAVKDVRKNVSDELIPWGSRQFAKARADGRREVLPRLRRSLVRLTRDRFGEPTAGAFSAEIESVEELGDFDRIIDGFDACDTGEALLDLVRTR